MYGVRHVLGSGHPALLQNHFHHSSHYSCIVSQLAYALQMFTEACFVWKLGMHQEEHTRLVQYFQ